MHKTFSLLAYKKAKLIEKMVDYYITIGAINPLLQAVLIVEEKENLGRS